MPVNRRVEMLSRQALFGGLSLARQAIKVSQEPGRLPDAADLMEEALNKFPAMREEYQGRVKLWRRGIAM